MSGMCERITERAASCICPSGLSLFCFNESSYEVFDCVENEDSACVVCGQIKAASATISGAHTDAAASPLGQLVRPSNNGSESAVWFIDFDSQKAFLASDEALVVEYRKAYGVAAAAETFDTDRWFAPSEFKIAVEGISLDSVSAGIGNSEKAIACNGEVEVWTRHDEARDVFVLVLFADIVEYFARRIIVNNDSVACICNEDMVF